MIEFYNEKEGTIIDLEKESCDIKTWFEDNNTKYICAKHEIGFYIFMSPHAILNTDEYSDQDPYLVARNFNSSFHQRR